MWTDRDGQSDEEEQHYRDASKYPTGKKLNHCLLIL